MADVVFRTSGSTGEAKEIRRTETSLLADANALVRVFDAIWGCRPFVVSTAPTDHIFGHFWRVLVPSLAGAEVFGETILSVEALDAAIAGRVNVLIVTTPSFLEKVLEHPLFAAMRGRITSIVTSGSPLRRATAIQTKDAIGVCPMEIFGSTEAGTVAWRRQDAGEEWNVFDGVEVSLDTEGRIVVDSPFAMERPLVMSDLARLVPPRRFLHLGRADRRVKILEEYVSLGAVERALESHPFVERARAEAFGDGVKRIGALLVASEAGRAAVAAGKFGDACRRLRGDLLPQIGPLGFPRRIRFVRRFPIDKRGKTKTADVLSALSAWCQEPVVLEWRESGDELSARLVFPPDSECFSGHFPGNPILPGVAQLFFLRHFARQAFPDFPDAGVWRRLKFQKLVYPGETLALDIRRQGPGRFDFACKTGEGVCLSGLLEGTP